MVVRRRQFCCMNCLKYLILVDKTRATTEWAENETSPQEQEFVLRISTQKVATDFIACFNVESRLCRRRRRRRSIARLDCYVCGCLNCVWIKWFLVDFRTSLRLCDVWCANVSDSICILEWITMFVVYYRRRLHCCRRSRLPHRSAHDNILLMGKYLLTAKYLNYSRQIFQRRMRATISCEKCSRPGVRPTCD